MCMSAALPSPATADIMDHFQGQVQVAPSIGFRDYGGVRRFSGGIATVRCRENNPLVRQRLTKEAGGGRVLVVDGGGSTRCALLGDMLAAGAVQNGWAGVIVHGCIRDSAAIAQLPLGVKAIGTNPTKSGKADPGEADVPVTFAGVVFTPGHWVYADEDGIVVSAIELALPAADNPAANASER
ncbi:ribonuclease activity regulator protein RraA [Tribonema minus]|uniref:4-hydroxy-4-methyl-2-oxoglutarate aldolase n=1 Tax=Tribonema minus TaxID=303371 RepID=A0A836C6L7_9STRA|nr:ribonuclease activity regulator protein RraA [Tribonema minus]